MKPGYCARSPVPACWRAVVEARIRLERRRRKRPEAQDYVVEADDSLSSGEVELGMGLEGAAGARPGRRRRDELRRARLLGARARRDVAEILRRGADRGRGGAPGRAGCRRQSLSPRWGRGLLLGATSRSGGNARRGRDRAVAGAAERRGRDALERSRPPRGALVQTDGSLASRRRARARRLRPARRRSAPRTRAAPWQGALMGWQSRAAGNRGGARPHPARGAWREASGRSARGGRRPRRVVQRPGLSLAGAEPARGGPARALTLAMRAADTPAGGGARADRTVEIQSRVAGARAAFECRRALGDAQRLAWGFEEQHRHAARTRPPTRPAFPPGCVDGVERRRRSARARRAARGMGRAGWSARARARGHHGPARGRRSTPRACGAHPLGVPRAAAAKPLLAAAASDRLVLRSLTGDSKAIGRGSSWRSPPAAARVEVPVWSLGTSGGPQSSGRWNLEWVRRSKPARDAAPSRRTPPERHVPSSPKASAGELMPQDRFQFGSRRGVARRAPRHRPRRSLAQRISRRTRARLGIGSGALDPRTTKWVARSGTPAPRAAVDLGAFFSPTAIRLHAAASPGLGPGEHRPVFGGDAVTRGAAHGYPVFGLSPGNTGDQVMLWQVNGTDIRRSWIRTLPM